MSKAMKIKFPKRIAGITIPKMVRKGPLRDFVNSSAGQLLIAEAIIAAGTAYAVRHTDPGSAAGRALRHPMDTLQNAGQQAGAELTDSGALLARSSARLSFAFGEAMRAFRDALASPNGGDVATAKTQDAGEVALREEGAAKKKSSSSRAEPIAAH
jgi:hypothetical protein